jgi:membrane protease YdiL (CAAX protease family)
MPGPAPDAAEPDAAEPATGAPAPEPIALVPDHPAPDRAAPAALVSTFSLEGRTVPALYLIGWVGTVMGLAVILVSLMAASSGAAPWIFLAGLVVLVVGLAAAAGSQAVERGRRPELAYRGPSPVLTFLLVMGLTLIAIVVVLAPLAALGLDPQSPLATAVSLLLTAAMYVGVVRLLVVGPGALSWADMGLRVPAPAAIRDLLVGGLLAIPVLVLTVLLGGLLARFLEPAPSPLPEAGDAVGLIANLVSAAIIAPVGEELFFRGFATTAWARAGGAGQAIVRGAVFFAIAHVLTLFDATFAEGAQRALFSFVALLPVATALGWVFLSRRSLYAAIGMHAAFNGLQVLALYTAARAL